MQTGLTAMTGYQDQCSSIVASSCESLHDRFDWPATRRNPRCQRNRRTCRAIRPKADDRLAQFQIHLRQVEPVADESSIAVRIVAEESLRLAAETVAVPAGTVVVLVGTAVVPTGIVEAIAGIAVAPVVAWPAVPGGFPTGHEPVADWPERQLHKKRLPGMNATVRDELRKR